MALAVVTIASGGLPIVETTSGMPVTEAANLRGVPVTKVVGKPGLPVTFETIGVAPGTPVLTTFATYDGTPSAGIVMSNGNRTVTHGVTSNGVGVNSRSTLGSGKYYFEVTIQGAAPGIGGNAIGIAPYAGAAFQDPQSNCTNGVGINLGTSSLIQTNTVNTTKNLGTQAIGSVFCAAIDMTARLAWFRRDNGNWNADGTANPATGVGGVAIPAGNLAPFARFTNSGNSTDAFTGNFGQAAFAFTAPSGFSLGWGT